MGVTALPEVVHQLLGGGMDPQTPATMVEQGTTSAQRQVISTLAGLPEAVVSAGRGDFHILAWELSLPVSEHEPQDSGTGP